jgi:hypothetical protein
VHVLNDPPARPFYNRALQTVIRQAVEPLLEEHRPSIMKRIVFEALDLGQGRFISLVLPVCALAYSVVPCPYLRSAFRTVWYCMSFHAMSFSTS